MRYIHGLPRCGGTLIAKCMRACGHTLFSEIHPRHNNFSVTRQAKEWYGLDVNGATTADQLVHADHQDPDVVVRVWDHIDFIGAPWVTPTFTLSWPTGVSVVRHPRDQFVSMRKLRILQAVEDKDIFKGMHAFALAAPGPIYTYEEFCWRPSHILRCMCEDLCLPYDGRWVETWHQQEVTGDSSDGMSIRIPEAKSTVPSSCRKQYRKICKLLGYTP